MSLLDKIKDFFVTRKQENKTSGREVEFELFRGSVFNQDWLTLLKARNLIETSYKSNPLVYSIVSFIAQKAAAIPWFVYRIKNEKAFRNYKLMSLDSGRKDYVLYRKAALEYIEGHPLEKILKYPNILQGWSEFCEQVLTYKLITGNSYIHMITAGRELKEMWSISPTMVEIETGNVDNPIAGYKVANNSGVTRRLLPSEVIHLRYSNPDKVTNLYGQSPLEAAARVIARSNAAYDMSTNSLQNNGILGIISSETDEAPLTQEQAEAIEEKLRQKSSASSRNRWVATSAKIKWQQMGLSPVDLGIIESDKMDLRTLCNVYHLPSELFNDSANKTYSNTREAGRALYTNAVIPLLASMRDEFNRWLAMNYDKSVVVDYDLTGIAELQESLDLLVNQLATAWWLTPNQKLEAMGWELSDNEMMDKIWVPASLIPMDMAAGEEDISDEAVEKTLQKLNVNDYEFWRGNGKS